MEYSLIDRHLIDPAVLASPAVHRFLPYQDADAAALAECLAADDRYDRRRLAELLADYNASIGGDPKTVANARRLAQPDAVVVVTGQQAGLLTGPLYTVYKIVTAINLAARQEAALGIPVVPVFWNATEDHDLSEIARFELPEQKWEVDFPRDGRAAEALRTEPHCRQLLRDFLATIRETDHRAEIATLIQPSFVDYGLYTSSVVARLFAGTGLVVLEPRLLRPMAGEFFARAIRERHAVRRCLGEGADAIAKGELPAAPAFSVDDGCGLFVLDGEGRRRRVTDDGKTLRAGPRRTTEAELLARIDADPRSFSTAAYLRPILQSLLLPNLAYVCGPGEFRYHLQLPPLYRHFDAVLPILPLRNQATLLTAREQKLARQLRLEPDDYFHGPEPFRRRDPLPTPVAKAMDDVRRQLAEGLDMVEQTVDFPTSQRRFASTRIRLDDQLARLEHKLHKDFRRHIGTDNRRLDRFFAAVRPRHLPQERVINVFYFLQARGPRLIGDLLETFDPAEPRHYLVHLP